MTCPHTKFWLPMLCESAPGMMSSTTVQLSQFVMLLRSAAGSGQGRRAGALGQPCGQGKDSWPVGARAGTPYKARGPQRPPSSCQVGQGTGASAHRCMAAVETWNVAEWLQSCAVSEEGPCWLTCLALQASPSAVMIGHTARCCEI